MSSAPPAVYLFGEFRLDPANHRLDRCGVPVTFPPKAFQLLVRLVENGSGLLTKEEIFDTLWADVVVQENNLTQQISLLRKTLGPEVIETVPRVGYRFRGEVRREAERVTAPPAAAVEPPAPLLPAAARPRRVIVAATVLCCCTLIAVVVAVMVQRNGVSGHREIRSLAILPLRPLGSALGTEYLGLGIADAIIHQISALQSIEVRPTSAVRQYTGAYDLAKAAKNLSVDAVLEGTIQRAGNRIRVRVQLVDVRRNLPIFSGKFDEPADDLFAVEDVVASAVVRALALQASGDRAQASKRRSREPGAYEAYLKGRFEGSKRTPDGIKASIPHYEEAIARDRTYAAAYAALGDSLNLMSMHRLALPVESFPRAKEAAVKALSIDTSLADAYVVLGTSAFYYDWDWAAAEQNLRRAIELDPQHAAARHIFANLLIATGRVDEAVATMNEAMRRDPLSNTISSVAAYQLYLARRYDDAIRQARKTLDRDTGYAQAHRTLGQAYIGRGNYDEGVAAIERTVNLIGEDSYALGLLANGYAHHPSRREEGRAMAPRLLDLLERRKLSPVDLVRYYAILGERKEAMRWLEATKERRDPGMVWLAVDPEFDGIRDEPRFREMIAAMNLAEADERLNGSRR